LIEGNGAPLVRLAARVQRALERLYHLDPLADVRDFIAVADEGEREKLLVREAEAGIFEIEVRLPTIKESDSLDAMCQVIEGVSHFVYIADRARIDRPSTQLELEMQAEVDKWVVLAASMTGVERTKLRARLFEHVSFLHEGEIGERYRLANTTAHKFVRAIENRDIWSMRGALRRFFSANQEEKLRLAQA